MTVRYPGIEVDDVLEMAEQTPRLLDRLLWPALYFFFSGPVFFSGPPAESR